MQTQLTLDTSAGAVKLYFETTGWTSYFLLDPNGAAVAGRRDLLRKADDLRAAVVGFGVPKAEAQVLARDAWGRLPDPNLPRFATILHLGTRLGRKVGRALELTPPGPW